MLGLECKTFEDGVNLEKVFSLGLAQMKAMTNEKDRRYQLSDLINNDFEHSITNSANTFKLAYQQAPKCACIELNVAKPRQKKKRIGGLENIPTF